MNKYKTVRWVKCTCPRGTFSHNCPVAHHRSMAWEIDTIFGLTASNNTGTGRKRRPRRVAKNYRRRDWKAQVLGWLSSITCSDLSPKAGRIFFAAVILLLIIEIIAQVQTRANSPYTFAELIGRQVGR